MMTSGFDPDLESHDFCYLTTTGRVTGQPHRIEIWFVVVDGCLYVISGGGTRSDWVANLMACPDLMAEVGADRWDARARLLEPGDHPARERLAERYQGWQPGQPLSDWAREGLLIEVGQRSLPPG